jgi:hypothetical protein
MIKSKEDYALLVHKILDNKSQYIQEDERNFIQSNIDSIVDYMYSLGSFIELVKDSKSWEDLANKKHPFLESMSTKEIQKVFSSIHSAKFDVGSLISGMPKVKRMYKSVSKFFLEGGKRVSISPKTKTGPTKVKPLGGTIKNPSTKKTNTKPKPKPKTGTPTQPASAIPGPLKEDVTPPVADAVAVKDAFVEPKVESRSNIVDPEDQTRSTMDSIEHKAIPEPMQADKEKLIEPIEGEVPKVESSQAVLHRIAEDHANSKESGTETAAARVIPSGKTPLPERVNLFNFGDYAAKVSEQISHHPLLEKTVPEGEQFQRSRENMNDFTSNIDYVYLFLFVMASIPVVGIVANFILIIKALKDSRKILAITTFVTTMLSLLIFHVADLGAAIKILYSVDVYSFMKNKLSGGGGDAAPPPAPTTQVAPQVPIQMQIIDASAMTAMMPYADANLTSLTHPKVELVPVVPVPPVPVPPATLTATNTTPQLQPQEQMQQMQVQMPTLQPQEQVQMQVPPQPPQYMMVGGGLTPGDDMMRIQRLPYPYGGGGYAYGYQQFQTQAMEPATTFEDNKSISSRHEKIGDVLMDRPKQDDIRQFLFAR